MIRCPMCQTENPVGSETCRLCHARLPETPDIEPAHEEESEPIAPAQMPDWLSRLRQEASGETPSTPPPEKPKSTDELDWLGEMPEVVHEEEGPPPGELPEWLGQAPPAVSQDGEAGEGEVPEWLARIRTKAREDGTVPAEAESAPLIADAEPEPESAAPSPPGPTPPAPKPEGEAPAGSLGLPEWLMAPDESPTVAPGPDEPEKPSWLEGVSQDSSKELPHVPALVFGSGAESDEPVPPIDLASIADQVPEWMEDSRSPETQAEKPNLAPATLPAWLEAMRPVDTFRSVVEFDSQEDQAVEAAGPLAGLRGVLLAEPVVAMPRAASGETTRLDVNEKQFAQAELLHRLVEDEKREVQPRPATRTRPDVLRWIVGGVLLLAVGIPAILGFPSLPLPAFAPVDLAALVGLVDSLPANPRTLVVFDYEAGATGEMETVSEPLLSHLMDRGAAIATLSTGPGGPALAERLIARVGASHNYVRGEDFAHLGYLAGGPAAVQLFAASPRSAVAKGFLEDPALGSVWNTPFLTGVQALSDFDLLVVITSGSEDARTWIEQASPYLAGHPLVAVVSQRAEPLVRPYYESTQPKVAGMLSGLTSATAYEQRLGRPDLAHSRWSPYGVGLQTAEFLLVLGILAGVASPLLRSRRR
jgi:hypothetical protein